MSAQTLSGHAATTAITHGSRINAAGVAKSSAKLIIQKTIQILLNGIITSMNTVRNDQEKGHTNATHATIYGIWRN